MEDKRKILMELAASLAVQRYYNFLYGLLQLGVSNLGSALAWLQVL
jgi:hypothetical protein